MFVIEWLFVVVQVYPMFGNSPILHAFWAAGFSFARGHFTVRVPYDCCLPMMFQVHPNESTSFIILNRNSQGEEIVIAVRAWTFGYDMYTPHNSVAFHFYHRKQRPPMFWENSKRHQGEAKVLSRINFLSPHLISLMLQLSGDRAKALIHFAADLNAIPQGFDHTDMDKYGLGGVRPVEDFFRVFGIDLQHRKITKDLCAWSAPGTMHKQLTRFMRQDRKGIDYSRAIRDLRL